MPSEAGCFDTLLQGLVDRPPQDGEKGNASGEADSLEMKADANASDKGTPDLINSVFVLLEGLLPRVAPNTPEGKGQTDGASSGLIPQGLQQAQDGTDPLTAPAQSRLMVSVQHQETHFKPVIEGAIPDAASPDMEGAESTPETTAPDFIDKPLKKSHLEHRNLAGSNTMPLPSQPVEEKNSSNADAPAEGMSKDGAAEHVETAKPLASKAMPSESTSLPQPTLQRMAGAITSEIRSMAGDISQRPLTREEAIRTVSIKASEGALRVLNLQLHPADLGAVTVKMRLAGDSLEMELHAEKEETAQLLRHDSERLSALLRGSGYRPDTIHIQVSDAAIQDRATASRQSSEPSMQGQSFHQGGASQEDRSRDRERQYANTRAEHHTAKGEDNLLDGRRSGGVYL
jgi:flagellar hook-length control protein FliK